MRTEGTIRACLITNPRSGRGRIDLSEALRVLVANGWQADVRQKLHGGHATELARDAAQEGYDVVVNCGGDGTLREIVDGVISSQVAVGTLPGGTANLWAHEVGIDARLRVAATQLVTAVRRRVDVGHVTINGRHGQHFLLMAGLGLDGAVMARVSKPLKNRIGPLAVGLAALGALPSFRFVPVRAELDGTPWQGRIAQIVVGNTRRYGGFTHITPEAYIDDGLLDVCLITAHGAVASARQAAALLLRQRPSAASAETYRVASVSIHTPVLLPLQLDGGAVHHRDMHLTAQGMTYRFTVAAQALSVLVPRTYGGALFQQGPLPGPLAHVAPRREVDEPGAKDERKTLRVLSVGIDRLTAVRLESGRLVTVRVTSATHVENVRGKSCEPHLWLAEVAEGDLIRVKGTKDRENNLVLARQIRMLAAPDRPD